MAQCAKCPQTFLTEWPKYCSRKDCPQRRAAEQMGIDPDAIELSCEADDGQENATQTATTERQR
jgi:hypothetical protein